MKKVIILVLLLLFIAACSGSRSSTRPNENFRVGSNGLVLQFLQNQPPPKQFDEEPLNVVAQVHNDGATDIKEGSAFIFLSGFDPSLISGISTFGKRLENLEGRDIDFREGGFDVVSFQGNVRDLRSRNIDKYEPTLLVTACYEYETIANPEVCIDGDPFAVNFQQKVCRGTDPPRNFASSQGAPVAVTRVQVEPAPRKTRFEITVENVGRGLVFQPGLGFLERCNPYSSEGFDFKDIDLVRLDEVKVGNTDIKTSCKPLENGMVRIRSATASSSLGSPLRGSGIIRCEIGDVTQQAFLTPLRIKLSYGYRDSIQRKVQIIQIP